MVAVCIMEVLLRHIPNAYQVKSEYLNTHQDSIKTLLLGSSHVLYGINPEFLSEEAINYGNVSQTIDIDYEIVNQKLDNLKALETVVLRLSYTTLFEQLKHGDEVWRLKDYQVYTDIDLNVKPIYNFEILSVKLKHNLERIYNYYILNKTSERIGNSGWSQARSHNTEIDIEEIGARIAEKHTVVNNDFYLDNVKHLENIIIKCNKKGVKVVLITMPAYASYVKHLDAVQLDSTLLVGKSMQNKFANCTYFNFLEEKSFGKQDFLDADHLNSQGAEKFSKRIDSILRQ
ncbi:conserved hypothetical protein [Formosa agariphila KMM 3901]|uniref:Uncharacterized protein n=2 Tax=Formosa TaxID=225842 RepID=T2KP52_FORAG|nr:conserved hypothetical protein [Formosa agariphila KMM 3901]